MKKKQYIQPSISSLSFDARAIVAASATDPNVSDQEASSDYDVLSNSYLHFEWDE